MPPIENPALRRIVRLAAADPCPQCVDSARLRHQAFAAWQRALDKQEAPEVGPSEASTDPHSGQGANGGCSSHSAR